MIVYVTLGQQKHVGTIPYETLQGPIIIPRIIKEAIQWVIRWIQFLAPLRQGLS
jgi:hypothetical protein